jgi:hypothetical protein
MLESVAALKNAKVYAGALIIQQNPKLKALDLGVESIVGKNLLGDSLLVEGNDALKDLAGLDNLHGSLPGAISITNNGALVSVKGLTKVTGAAANVYGNSVEIVANKRLQDLTGLKLGGVIKGAVVVSGNGALKSLQGLCGVTSVAGVNAAKTSIDLSNNPKLVDAACLSNMGGLVKGNINLSGTSLASVAPLVKGKNPVTKVLGDIKVDMLHCLPNNEAKFLSSVCSTNACRTNIARARKCSWTGSSSNVFVGSGAQKPCGGASDAGWNTWSSAGSSGLYMDVDSSACNFALTPGYVTSVQGDAGHWQLVGVNSVYSATKNGFRAYVWHPQLRGSYRQYFAKRYNWRINWVADASQKAGVTKHGKSGWKQLARTPSTSKSTPAPASTPTPRPSSPRSTAACARSSPRPSTASRRRAQPTARSRPGAPSPSAPSPAARTRSRATAPSSRTRRSAASRAAPSGRTRRATRRPARSTAASPSGARTPAARPSAASAATCARRPQGRQRRRGLPGHQRHREHRDARSPAATAR